MKKIRNILIAFFCAFVLLSNTTSYAKTNTVPAGYIGVYTVQDLNAIRNNLSGKYILMADIDMSGYTQGGPLDTGHGWTPIGKNGIEAFSGVFDGNGHRLSNACIYGEIKDSFYAGIFGCVSGGTIKNLGLENIYINITDLGNDDQHGSACVGSVAAYIGNDSLVENCYANGMIKYTGKTYGTYGGCETGGLIGSAEGSTVKNCYTTVSVDSTAELVGGIVGNSIGSDLESLYTYSIVKGEYDVGAAIGWGPDGNNVYYVQSPNGKLDERATALSSNQASDKSYYVGFDFENVWTIDKCGRYGYPQLLDNMQCPIAKIVVTPPTKLDYYTTEKIDVAGGKLQIYYASGMEAETNLTEDMLLYTMKEGTLPVTVKYAGQTATFNVNVKKGEFVCYFDENGGDAASKTDKKVVIGNKFGTLPKVTRSKYIFTGWYTKKVGGELITEKSIVNQTDDFSLYAHWEKVSLSRPQVKLVAGKKQINVKWNKIKDATGYEVVVADNSKFKKAKKKSLNKLAVSFKKLKAKKKYYAKVRAYKKDSKGKKVYSSWSKVKNKKTKK